MTDRPNAPPPLTYADAGVDIDAGNALVDRIKPAVASTKRAGAAADLGGFGGLFDLAACKYKDPILVAATDGVGTKLKLAIDAQNVSGVGIDLVAMCVNDLIVQGAEPLFFLDYFATGLLSVEAAASVVEGIADGCRQANAALIGGETAEMPGLYKDGEFDLAGFCVGAVERDGVLPAKTIQPGDQLIALASCGVHSNGYSLVRRILDRSGLTHTDPAPFAPDRSVGDIFLEPTRIYVRSFLSALKNVPGIKAAAHITGGGLTENIPRALPDHVCAEINLSSWTAPALFTWLRDEGNVAGGEMLRTFNCGVGMVLVVDHEAVSQIEDHLSEQGETVWRLGAVVERVSPGDKALIYQGSLAGVGEP